MLYRSIITKATCKLYGLFIPLQANVETVGVLLNNKLTVEEFYAFVQLIDVCNQ